METNGEADKYPSKKIKPIKINKFYVPLYSLLLLLFLFLLLLFFLCLLPTSAAALHFKEPTLSTANPVHHSAA